ncbi:MAG: hypothetical protein NT090_00835, partial [Acidobacteria bacterium]|nr:hypothetical protein [Acidobacteriota bacterium]
MSVVKNIRITGSVHSNSGARAVLLQAQQAFEHTISDEHGNPERVHRVYVVTPFPTSPSAREDIAAAMVQRAGQIFFVDGPILFDLFRQFWPAFLSDEASAVQRYLSELAHSINANDPIPRVVSLYPDLEITQPRLPPVYVQQDLYRKLFAFKPGEAIEEDVPSDEEFRAKWSRRTVEDAVSRLSRLAEAVVVAEGCGFLSTSTNIAQVQPHLDQFGAALESAYNESVRKKYAPHSASVPNVNPDTKLFLQNKRTLVSHAHRLRRLLTLALQAVDDAATVSRKLQNRRHSTQFPLSDPAYLGTCKLNEFFTMAGARILEPCGSFVEAISPDALTDWSGALLIVGPPGYGKTSFCLQNALKDM